MAAIHDLLAQIQDEGLRNRIEQEVDKLAKTKKFGLVFEQHLPECTPLYDMPIKIGVNVMRRNTKEDKSLYVALKVDGESVICGRKDNLQEQVTFDLKDIVRVAEFGEPIYPYLKPIDSVCNAPDSDLWHTLIEADNYHALQLLEYLYAGKVDCIYIDPPYNTGARDWKYNNDYVDGNDAYRHSKWLSMMEKRLRIAKKILNPKDSVLIVTIDEKEYLHLGCLLEEMFPASTIQMVTSVINPKGTPKKDYFARVEEYIYYIWIGEAKPNKTTKSMLGGIESEEQETKEVRWASLQRSGGQSLREDTDVKFYPIFLDEKTGKILRVGNHVDKNFDISSVLPEKGEMVQWPIKQDGTEGCWQVSDDTLRLYLSQGRVKIGTKNSTTGKWTLYYLMGSDWKRVENGEIAVLGKDSNGTLILGKGIKAKHAKTVWSLTSHSATDHGTAILKKILPNGNFSYPKSLYAVHDTIELFVANKPNALIVDFFAGSGTTLHAVNLLNSEDGGHRRCILVTNNEVSDDEAKKLTNQGYTPGDKQWENLGIAENVTWPRTVCSIKGQDSNGNPLKGNYLVNNIPMSEGFKSNAIFFKLGFLDKTSIALGLQFKQLLPLLWMKAGSIGKCPELDGEDLPKMVILEENKFAVLLDESFYTDFLNEISQVDIRTVFITTDYEVNYRSMIRNMQVDNTYQLYRDYLDNFRINNGRN